MRYAIKGLLEKGCFKNLDEMLDGADFDQKQKNTIKKVNTELNKLWKVRGGNLQASKEKYVTGKVQTTRGTNKSPKTYKEALEIAQENLSRKKLRQNLKDLFNLPLRKYNLSAAKAANSERGPNLYKVV